MTEFPELLNKFIEQKNIHIYSMAKYCGLDRSTLYKIIKGNRRPPSASVRDKMACFMHLTPDETRQFEQAWEISFTGKLTYCRRKSIEDFLLNYICLFDYLFISSQMSAKPYFIGSTGIFLLW